MRNKNSLVARHVTNGKGPILRFYVRGIRAVRDSFSVRIVCSIKKRERENADDWILRERERDTTPKSLCHRGEYMPLIIKERERGRGRKVRRMQIQTESQNLTSANQLNNAKKGPCIFIGWEILRFLVNGF